MSTQVFNHTKQARAAYMLRSLSYRLFRYERIAKQTGSEFQTVFVSDWLLTLKNYRFYVDTFLSGNMQMLNDVVDLVGGSA